MCNRWTEEELNKLDQITKKIPINILSLYKYILKKKYLLDYDDPKIVLKLNTDCFIYSKCWHMIPSLEHILTYILLDYFNSYLDLSKINIKHLSPAQLYLLDSLSQIFNCSSSLLAQLLHLSNLFHLSSTLSYHSKLHLMPNLLTHLTNLDISFLSSSDQELFSSILSPNLSPLSRLSFLKLFLFLIFSTSRFPNLPAYFLSHSSFFSLISDPFVEFLSLNIINRT